MSKSKKTVEEDLFHTIESAFAETEGTEHTEEPAFAEVPPIEYKGQRVITTELLAQVYETTPKNIRMNFANHEDNFKEGIHYYLLQGEELQRFKNYANDIGIVGKNAPMLYLWTERGANRHCKILDTPKAWEQFDNLEETYFIVKDTVRGIAGGYTLNRYPPTTSPDGLAKLMGRYEKRMEQMNCSPAEILSMMQHFCMVWGVTPPEVVTRHIPEQLSLYDLPVLQSGA